MKKIITAVFAIASLHEPSAFCAAAPDFFIVKTEDKTLSKHSANTLKEMLGEMARDVFKRSIEVTKQVGNFHITLATQKTAGNLHKELGLWQVELASLQSHCSQVLEKLIENQKPFKKASKKELQDAYKSMQEAFSTMETLLTHIKKEHKKYEAIKDTAPDKDVEGALVVMKSCVNKTKNIQVAFNNHPCLKTT